MITPDGFKPVDWADVRKGDVLFHENGDRLTVTERASGIRVLVAGTEIGRMDAVWVGHRYVPFRKLPDLSAVPTEPGAYTDKDGDIWELHDYGIEPWVRDTENFTAEELTEFAPFTRLVPMPTKDALSRALEEGENTEDQSGYDDLADAVLALLSGDDTTGGESDD